jgi:hypothetical protein
MKVLKVPVQKWRKNPDGFSYYAYEKGYGLEKINYYELDEYHNKIFVTTIEEILN